MSCFCYYPDYSVCVESFSVLTYLLQFHALYVSFCRCGHNTVFMFVLSEKVQRNEGMRWGVAPFVCHGCRPAQNEVVNV